MIQFRFQLLPQCLQIHAGAGKSGYHEGLLIVQKCEQKVQGLQFTMILLGGDLLGVLQCLLGFYCETVEVRHFL